MVPFCDQISRSELDARGAEDLMGPETRVDLAVRRWREVLGEDHRPAAADAVTERAQAVGRSGAVAGEAAAFATGCGLAALVQRVANVPSRCSSALEVFWAAGSEDDVVLPGAAAYGNVAPPPSGKT
jgi:hypothetical protein